MPTSKRGQLKRKHDQAVNGLIRAAAYLADLHKIYNEHHPDRAEGYEAILMIVLQAIEFIEKMRQHV